MLRDNMLNDRQLFIMSVVGRKKHAGQSTFSCDVGRRIEKYAKDPTSACYVGHCKRFINFIALKMHSIIRTDIVNADNRVHFLFLFILPFV